jgi:hypothetical protein
MLPNIHNLSSRKCIITTNIVLVSPGPAFGWLDQLNVLFGPVTGEPTATMYSTLHATPQNNAEKVQWGELRSRRKIVLGQCDHPCEITDPANLGKARAEPRTSFSGFSAVNGKHPGSLTSIIATK